MYTKETFKTAIKGTKFAEDLTAPLSVNGGESNMGMWNLLVSIRDVKLYKAGLKPNRFWKITNVKKYFGVKGTADSILVALEQYKEYLFENREAV